MHAHEQPCAGGLGRAWRIAPQGLNTPVPMTLEWRYGADEAQVRGMSRLAIATQRADGAWARRRAACSTTWRSARLRVQHARTSATGRWWPGGSCARRRRWWRSARAGAVDHALPHRQRQHESRKSRWPNASSMRHAFDTWDWSINGMACGISTHGWCSSRTTSCAPVSRPTKRRPPCRPPTRWPSAFRLPSSAPFEVRTIIT